MKPLPLVLGIAFALTSCLEIEQTIALAPDGSGRQKVTLGLTDRVLGLLRRSSAAVDASLGAADPHLLFDEARVRSELQEAGLKLEHHRAFENRQRRCVEIEASFPTIAVLRRSPLSGSAAEWRFVRGEKPGTVHVILYPQGRAAWRRAREQAREIETAPDPNLLAFFERRREELRGLEIELSLRLPGAVLACSSNLTRIGRDAVAAKITDGDVRTPRDLVLLLAPRYEVLIDGRGCAFPLEER
jgi:hypothetical protein